MVVPWRGAPVRASKTLPVIVRAGASAGCACAIAASRRRAGRVRNAFITDSLQDMSKWIHLAIAMHAVARENYPSGKSLNGNTPTGWRRYWACTTVHHAGVSGRIRVSDSGNESINREGGPAGAVADWRDRQALRAGRRARWAAARRACVPYQRSSRTRRNGSRTTRMTSGIHGCEHLCWRIAWRRRRNHPARCFRSIRRLWYWPPFPARRRPGRSGGQPRPG